MGKMIKVVSWYDNEAGYSARLADLTAKIAKLSSKSTSKKTVKKAVAKKKVTRKTKSRKLELV